jgi:hypothetical protein
MCDSETPWHVQHCECEATATLDPTYVASFIVTLHRGTDRTFIAVERSIIRRCALCAIMRKVITYSLSARGTVAVSWTSLHNQASKPPLPSHLHCSASLRPISFIPPLIRFPLPSPQSDCKFPYRHPRPHPALIGAPCRARRLLRHVGFDPEHGCIAHNLLLSFLETITEGKIIEMRVA